MEEEEIENTFVYQSMDKYKRILTDKIVLRYFYLPRIRKRYYNKIKLSELEKLLLVLTSEKVGDFPDLLEENDMLRNVQEEMYKASVDDEVIGEYDAEFEAEFNMVTRIREGYNDGIKEGKKEEKIANAKALIKNGVALETISKSIGLDIETLNMLKKDI